MLQYSERRIPVAWWLFVACNSIGTSVVSVGFLDIFLWRFFLKYLIPSGTIIFFYSSLSLSVLLDRCGLVLLLGLNDGLVGDLTSGDDFGFCGYRI